MTSTALTAIPSANDLAAVFTLSQQLCRTEFIPRAYQGRPEAVLAPLRPICSVKRNTRTTAIDQVQIGWGSVAPNPTFATSPKGDDKS